MIAKIGEIDKFANIEEYFESSIDELNDWVKSNIVKRNGKFNNGKPRRFYIT